ncbi:MAG: helix-turn-helix domain-containing protein [Solirubrobacterales bacterium]
MDVTRKPDSLAQPTRATLFERLCELRRPATTDELAVELKRHPNGVRLHLEQMEEGGLVLREREKKGRGRPRDVWSVDPDAQPRGVRPTAYLELSQWLAQAVEQGPVDPGAIADRGREIGLGLIDPTAAEAGPVDRFRNALSAMGFQPAVEPEDDGEVTVCLRNCPYRDVVRDRQSLICALHRGVSSGLLETIDPAIEMTGFEPHDPDEAGCLIKVRLPG